MVKIKKIVCFGCLLFFFGCKTSQHLPQPIKEVQPSPTTAQQTANTPAVDQAPTATQHTEILPPGLVTGAGRFSLYLPVLTSAKGVALVVNQTSMVGNSHLADTLWALGVKLKVIFAPEHGIRGDADAGETIHDAKDPKTGVPLASLYGSKKKPSAEDLKDVDWVVFDIQDVGTRFYTYISTLHYVMDACAELDKHLLVLDRPNPNGHYVDGPVLQPAYKSFVGMHPVPIVHGLTIGEYARLINGSGWLSQGRKCDLTVAPCARYDHQTPYELPIKPSPNLPNNRAIYLYPSICFFEGTVASLGRGTDKQFQVLGHPDFPAGDYTFTPVPKPGAKQPPLEGKLCRGYDLSTLNPESLRKDAAINLEYLLDFYRQFPDKENFFLKNNFIDKLAGSDALRTQVINGLNADQIKASWKNELDAFKDKRRLYLMYRE